VHQTARRRTIADVARASGVSKAAVSFAFNSPERLSADTVARIREVATELGYRPDPVARMLAQRRTMTVGVLTPQPLHLMFPDPYFGALTAGIACAAEEAGYALQFISPLHGSLARAVHEASVDGVIAVGLWPDHSEIGEIRRSGVPFVLVDALGFANESNVTIDDGSGAEAAARHLLELGHRELAIIAFAPPRPEDGTGSERPATGDISARRLSGYRRAIRAAGLDVTDEAIACGPSEFEHGARALRELVARGTRFTGVLAMSDVLAIGALRAARDLGWRVPQDLSIVGFDDIELASYVDPPLTTVHQSPRDKGETALRLRLGRLDRSSDGRPEHRHVETCLTVRGSTGPAPRERQEVARDD
jgi:DNA-binding LacI/PurR family transcriptional regulator